MARLAEKLRDRSRGQGRAAKALAKATGAVVVAKGPDTVIAAPDGRVGAGAVADQLAGRCRHGRRPGGHRRKPPGAQRTIRSGRPARRSGSTAKRRGRPGRRSSRRTSPRAFRAPTPPPCERTRNDRPRRRQGRWRHRVGPPRAARGAGRRRSTSDGALLPGPHHATPPCRHFATCGGCQLQHLEDEALAGFVRDRVVHAAEQQGLEPERVAPRPPLAAAQPPPGDVARRQRRRPAADRLSRSAVAPHRRHARVPRLAPELFALVEPLRRMLASGAGIMRCRSSWRWWTRVSIAAIGGLQVEGLEETEALLEFCREQGLARLMLDQGFGAEAFWEPEPVTVTLSGVIVPYPPRRLSSGHRRTVNRRSSPPPPTGSVAMGAWSISLPASARSLSPWRRADRCLPPKPRAMHTSPARRRRPARACRSKQYTATCSAIRYDRRNCANSTAWCSIRREPAPASRWRKSLRAACRVSFTSAAIRRAGRAMAAMLKEAGYRLAEVRPVGQFRWSTHVELASLFVR